MWRGAGVRHVLLGRVWVRMGESLDAHGVVMSMCVPLVQKED